MSILSDFREVTQEKLIPLQVTLELTYRCNERCGHCYLATYDDRADGRPTLTLSEWQRILDELALAKTLYLILIGGEAMMHPQFWGIAEYGAKRNFVLSLITNGLLVDERAADRFSDLNFYQVTVSFYSLDPAIHDRMTRRVGSHAATQAAIKRLQKKGVGVGLNCLLTRENIEGCFELEAWAKANGLVIQFDPMVTPKSDASLASTVTRASRAQLTTYFTTLKQLGRGHGPQPKAEAVDPVCNAGRGKCAVNPYGDLLTCLEVREAIGNLREKSFADLWHSPKAQELRGYRVRDLKFDSSCGDGAFCDHCPGMAGAEVGDRMAPIPFLMELAQIKRQVFESDSPGQP